jgi:cytidylate kinase
MAASNVSAIPQVREFLLDFQRKLAEKNSVVMDGRDIGTVVIPNADIKIFLTASAEERTMRRYSEYREKGMDVDFNALLEEIKTRDYNDSHRKVAPLTKAKDAVLIDNTGFSLEQTVNKITDMVEERLK